MKKAYFIAPIIGVIIFAVFYFNFLSEHDAKLAAIKADKERQRQEKIQRDVEAQQKAYQDAITLQEKRKKERADREARDQADKDAVQAAQDAREKAYNDLKRQNEQVTRVNKDIEIEKEGFAKIEAQKKSALSEQEFLKTYVKQAEANQKSLEDVIAKIAAADKAADDAAKAAARAKTSS